ncbi:divisome protein SepX/GlpR [Actinophytocola sp.]|uniref:divisome protein SepX/GlpR n=1 Tax=Actinophytocola sp. TaxID=1872138 RepID=UPI003D6B8624
MPSSLVVVALVLAWLVVLVPMIVRKRQEVAKTADSELAARVVRSGSGEADTDTRDDPEYGMEEAPMRDTDMIDEDLGEEFADDEPEPVADEAAEDVAHDADRDTRDEMSAGYYDEADLQYARRYRPGRGGFDPEAAFIIAKAKYAFRQRVVLAMLIGAVASAVVAGVVFPMLWWGHGAIDVVLISYLVYLRRQVRIETEIRERRLARMNRVRRAQAAAARQRSAESAYEPEVYETYENAYEKPYETAYEEPEAYDEAHEPDEPGPRERVSDGPYTPPVVRAGAVVVDLDDEDPAFEDLDEPGSLPYRRAVGE